MSQNPNPRFVRYRSSTERNGFRLELEFDGGAEAPGQENPKRTDACVRFLEKANHCFDSAPLILRWERKYGHLKMPEGSWNGIGLVLLLDDEIIIGLSNRLMQLDRTTGNILWEATPGNTPIYQIIESTEANQVIVFNGYYGFKHQNNLSNVSSYSTGGEEIWRAELPTPDDIYSSAPYFEGAELKSSSWQGSTCSIDAKTGEITGKQFTK